MRLLIDRHQAEQTSMFGRSRGMEFTLRYHLQLTPEEQQLIDRYGLANHVLVERDDDRGRTIQVTVAVAQGGDQYAATSIAEILRSEGLVRSACQNLAGLLAAARGFGGQEAIDF